MGKRGPRTVEPSKRRCIWATETQYALIKLLVERVKKGTDMISVLAKMRANGIEFEIEGGELFVSRVNPPLTGKELEEIKTNKPMILAVLGAEALAGKELDHSALLGGLARTYRQTAEMYEAGIAKQECRELVDGIDAVLAFASLPDALKAYMAKMPEMSLLIARINEERANSLTGRQLHDAAGQVFARKKGLFDDALL